MIPRAKAASSHGLAVDMPARIPEHRQPAATYICAPVMRRATLATLISA